MSIRINDFKLLDKIYIANGRPCKVFIPPVKINTKYYWVMYLDNNDISVVKKEDLSTSSTVQVLWGLKGSQ